MKGNPQHGVDGRRASGAVSSATVRTRTSEDILGSHCLRTTRATRVMRLRRRRRPAPAVGFVSASAAAATFAIHGVGQRAWSRHACGVLVLPRPRAAVVRLAVGGVHAWACWAHACGARPHRRKRIRERGTAGRPDARPNTAWGQSLSSEYVRERWESGTDLCLARTAFFACLGGADPTVARSWREDPCRRVQRTGTTPRAHPWTVVCDFSLFGLFMKCRLAWDRSGWRMLGCGVGGCRMC
jgi:hypothetical protein